MLFSFLHGTTVTFFLYISFHQRSDIDGHKRPTQWIGISTVLNDSERGAAFLQETKDFIRQFLVPDSNHSISKSPIITNFEVVGVAIRDACANCESSLRT